MLNDTTRKTLKEAFGPPVVRRSLGVAAVVGTILNFINQGDTILNAGDVNVVKLCLTYCVPFFVSSYGAYSALITGKKGLGTSLP